MFGHGIEVFIPIRFCMDNDHEREVRAKVQEAYNGAYVQFDRIAATIAFSNGVVAEHIIISVNTILGLGV